MSEFRFSEEERRCLAVSTQAGGYVMYDPIQTRIAERLKGLGLVDIDFVGYPDGRVFATTPNKQE